MSGSCQINMVKVYYILAPGSRGYSLKPRLSDAFYSGNIGERDGLVPSGKKPFPVPMLTKIHDTKAMG